MTDAAAAERMAYIEGRQDAHAYRLGGLERAVEALQRLIRPDDQPRTRAEVIPLRRVK